MEEKKSAGIPIVGFLVVEKTSSEDGYIAALMVTDNHGFRQSDKCRICELEARHARTMCVFEMKAIEAHELRQRAERAESDSKYWQEHFQKLVNKN